MSEGALYVNHIGAKLGLYMYLWPPSHYANFFLRHEVFLSIWYSTKTSFLSIIIGVLLSLYAAVSSLVAIPNSVVYIASHNLSKSWVFPLIMQIIKRHKKRFKKIKIYIEGQTIKVYIGVFKGAEFTNDLYFVLKHLLHCVWPDFCLR